jgi:hypothetical protein
MNEELPERIRSILSSEAVWVEPSSEFEQRIEQLAKSQVEVRRRRRLRLWLPVAAAVTTLVVGTLVTFNRPDWQMNLAGTTQAPGATAVVSGWSQGEGTRLQLDVEGLPDAPEGSYYEIWLTSADDLHVSGGTFKGDGSLTAMVGVRRGDFPRIWITIEQIDENEEPSSDTVLDTTGF